MSPGFAALRAAAPKIADAQLTLLTAIIIALLMAACAPPVSRTPEAAMQRPEGFPEAFYRAALERKERVFVVDPARSLLVIEVRRGGSLARLGHDHVVAGHLVQGYAAPDSRRADLYVAVEQLVVDEPELRAQAGFDTQPTEDDIAGTRKNMLTRVLGAERYPFVLIAVTQRDVAARDAMLDVALTLRGTTRVYRVPVEIGASENEINASGRFAVRQSDFGIEPLSILGGAITVQDEIELRFDVRARRLAS